MRKKLRQMTRTKLNGIGSIYFRGLLNVVLLRVSKEFVTSFSQQAFIQDQFRNECLKKTSHKY